MAQAAKESHSHYADENRDYAPEDLALAIGDQPTPNKLN
jgi:hypothetical protein